MEIKIDWKLKRSKHALERMISRGISQREFKEAMIKGKKKKINKCVFEVFSRYYSIVYEQQIYKEANIRKIFPITVKLW